MPLIMMIFSTIYGFHNAARGYYMMGHGAIGWFILAALGFFIPFAIMMVEFAYTFRESKGGMFAWLESSMGQRYAFVVCIMWCTAYAMWFVQASNIFWIPVARFLELFNFNGGLNSVIQALYSNSLVIGCLGMLMIATLGWAVAKGLRSVGIIGTIGGVTILALNALLLLGGFLVLCLHKFEFAEPIQGIKSFIAHSHKPNDPLGLMSFATFAIFSYCCLEIVSGLLDKVDNPKKTFPKATAWATTIITVGYSLMIFTTGMFTNWLGVMQRPDVNLANVIYVVMEELGKQLGLCFGMDEAGANIMARIFGGITGLSMVMAQIGGFFVYFYSPMKQVIEGTPKKFWPSFMLKRKNDMPVGAIYTQSAIIIAIVALVTFSGIKDLMNLLVKLVNVAIPTPYIFVAIAYCFFRKNTSIEKPLMLIKNNKAAIGLGILLATFVGLANLFAVFQPVLRVALHQSDAPMSEAVVDTILMMAGPLLFATLGFILYQAGAKKEDVEI